MLRQAALQRLACRISHLAADLFPASDVCCLSTQIFAPCLLTTQPAHITAPAPRRLLSVCTTSPSSTLARGLATEIGEDSPPSTAGSSEDSQDTAAGTPAADGGTQGADIAGTASEGSADASASAAEAPGEPEESQGAAAAPEQEEPELPPYVEPEFPQLPHNSWAPWLIQCVEQRRAGEEQPLTLNFAGEHSSGWEIYDVDEENLITWFVLDLAGGRVPNNDDNALLSDAAKVYMYKLRKEAKWSVEQIARLFAVRQQRVAAVIALREMEHRARAEGRLLYDDLQAKMDAVHGCTRLEGTGERHVRLLPSRPMFEVVDGEGGQPGREGRKGRKGRAAAGRRAAAGGGGGGIPGGTPGRKEDPGWESELRAREEEVAAYEERILVHEFMERLAFNTGKVGTAIRKESLAKEAPARPKPGWSIVVRPAGRGVDYEPFVAAPGGPRHTLSPDEALYLQRMKPRTRRKFV